MKKKISNWSIMIRKLCSYTKNKISLIIKTFFYPRSVQYIKTTLKTALLNICIKKMVEGVTILLFKEKMHTFLVYFFNIKPNT